MNQFSQNNNYIEHPSTENLDKLPETFAEAVAKVKQFALEEVEKDVVQKQLYYHTREHANSVQRRADRIFQAIRPYWEASLGNAANSEYLTQMKLLLDLCAVAHDMVQEFVPQTQPHKSRQREVGASEAATIAKLINYIEPLNQQVRECNPNSPALFRDLDIQIITEAIEATVCLYDASEQAIYQPDLYNPNKELSLVARIVAIADIGSLGMEGVASYNKEGSLIFLEENPDIIQIILNQEIPNPSLSKQELYESLRQRLLKRSRFQVNLAKSRLARYTREFEGFSGDAIPILRNEIFKYLNQETIHEIESLTPTKEDTTLRELIEFFELEKYVIPCPVNHP